MIGAMRLRDIRLLPAFALGLISFLQAQDADPLHVVDLATPVALDKLAAQLATKRVVFIGEFHDRYDHHLNQLEIIRRLYEADHNLAIGVEYFQQPFQSQVDDYINGRSTEQEFLRASEYYPGWGYDYRLYAPIFRFARENKLPVRALNVPKTMASQVGKTGLAGLSTEQRAYLPKDIPPADDAYKARLRSAFEGHGAKAKPGDFDHFVEAQVTWDEGMATSAAKYLNDNPTRRMVILAGSGHISYGSGIPKRVARQTGATYAIVLSSGEEIEPDMADYLLLTKKQNLPPAGTLGITMEEKDGEVRIKTLSPGGAAEKAGLKKGNVLAAVDGQPLKSTADLRLALWDKKPGDRVKVGTSKGQVLDIELGGRPAMPPAKP
jgi:uncharacterized iron-regulated protein